LRWLPAEFLRNRVFEEFRPQASLSYFAPSSTRLGSFLADLIEQVEAMGTWDLPEKKAEGAKILLSLQVEIFVDVW